jgi:predicted ATPase
MRPLKTGDAHVEYAPIGHTTNLASRMQAVARSGSVVVSDATRKLVEGYFQLKAIGPTKVKGISEPIQVYEVVGLGPLRTRLQRSATRGYTKFVGRDREMEALKRAAELARQGHGQIVAAMADAGVGKSRLFYEFKAVSQSGCLVLEALSLSHGKATAYLPLIDLLYAYFRIAPDDDGRTRREKVAGKVTMLDRSLEEESLPYLFALLGIGEGLDPLAGMDEQIRRRRTQDAVKRVLLRESLNQPLMLIFEDLHWVDDETQGFLNLLAEGVANAPVLLLVNYRPEYTHQWSSKTYYTQLRLDPLGKESAAEMLSGRIGDSPDLGPLKRLVLERTEGNPLFIEELVEALFDEGVLVRNGAVKVTRPLGQLKIPPTVQGILAARIDRLPPEAKELLQTLAVIGSEFPLTLVRQVVQLPADRLDRLLDVLQAGEFVYEQPAMGDVEYRFKHDLTHDAAYKSVLTERRKLLHQQTAQAIEALYSQRLEDHYVDLAHHYCSSDSAAKAVEYLRLAGEQAMDRGGYAQALANLEPALQLIERLPEGEERLRAEVGVRMLEARVAPVLHGVASAQRLETSERVCELSEQLGDDSALLRGLFNMGFVYFNRGETQRAQEITKRCLALAEQNEDGEILPSIHLLAARCAYGSGELLDASSRFNALMERLVSAPSRPTAGIVLEPWMAAPGMLAPVEQMLGRTEEALKLSDEGLRRARPAQAALCPFRSLRVSRRAPRFSSRA